MPQLSIHVDGDACWPDLALGPDLDLDMILHGELVSIAALPGGMASGKVSVTVRITLDDGRTVLAETSLALLHMALSAFVARYGEPS